MRQISFKSPAARELIRFCLVSALGFAVDFSMLWILAVKFGVHYALSTALAFVMGGLFVYLLSIKYVFDYRRMTNGLAESMAFVVLGLIGLACNVGLVVLVVNWTGMHVLYAKIFASGVTLFVNFGTRKIVLFSKQSKSEKQEAAR